MREFAGKGVVITGAASGLGHALALRFGRAGARVAALDRDRAVLQPLTFPHGIDVLPLLCDVTQASECAAAMASVRRHFGAIDLLINNAGISHRSAFARTRGEVIERVMAVNFFGAVHCTQAALADLVARRGMVIAISSVAGFAPLIARTGYAASKHALHGFFGSLRSELEAQGVKVLLVCPSFIATGIEKNALGGDGAATRHAQHVVGRRGSAEQVAERIFQAARREQRLLLPDRIARLSWWVMKLAPRVYERQMARRLGGEMTPE